MNWYTLHTTDIIDTPALLVYPLRIQQNIEILQRMICDVDRLRPHVKTHKTREITRMQLDAGIRKFKCATIAEAEMLGECGAPDVLLAYPLYGAKLQRFVALIRKFPQTHFSAIVDNMDGLKNLSTIAVLNKLEVDVFVDLNIGMGRTGIQPGHAALALYRLCAEIAGIRIQGFHAYDGHVREIDLNEREKHCAQNYKPIARLITQLVDEGYAKPQLVIGGSPSFPIYAKYPNVECSLLNTPHLKPISHSEEHLVLDAGEGHSFKVGDVLYALPIHICPTVALYDKLLVVENNAVVEEWEVVARKR